MLVQKYQWRWTPPHLFRGQRSERWLFGLWRLSSRAARWPTGALPSAYSWSVKINGNQENIEKNTFGGKLCCPKITCILVNVIITLQSPRAFQLQKLCVKKYLLLNDSLWILFPCEFYWGDTPFILMEGESPGCIALTRPGDIEQPCLLEMNKTTVVFLVFVSVSWRSDPG